jgi:hypothetical protein
MSSTAGIPCDAQALSALAHGKREAISGVGQRMMASSTRSVQIPGEDLVEEKEAAEFYFAGIMLNT